jgi:signal transduction histidine kinase
MKSIVTIFSDGIHFVRNNPQIIYTLFLVVAIPLAFFFTSEQFLKVARDQQNKLERGRIGVLQDVFVLFAQSSFYDRALLRDHIRVIGSETETLSQFSIIGTQTNNTYPILVALSPSDEGGSVVPDPLTSSLIGLSRADPHQSFSAEFFKDGVRYWRSARAIEATNTDGVMGYVLTDLSMAESDAIAENNIANAYMTLVIIILLIIVLLARQARIIDYATLYTKLKEVDTMKDDFVSMAAHELRSPLTIIRGYTELIESEPLSPKGRENLSLITTFANQLNMLVNDILDVSRLQQGRMSFQLKVEDVSPEVAAIARSFEQPAHSKGLTLSFTPFLLSPISVDRDRFRQVLINIIGNAVKYTNQGGVTVTTSEDNERVTIRVSDTGIGISSDEQQKLFQKFYRVKNKDTEMITGTGLGLWISAQITKAMNGKISIESIKGKGTDIIISFPKAST